jgi:flavodoxin
MKIGVYYYSKTGNTKKIAEAIAEEAGVKAVDISSDPKIEETYDLIFLGTGKYYGSLDKAFQRFLSSLDPEKVKAVTPFSTNFKNDDANKEIKYAAEQKQIPVTDESFRCYGRWLGFKKDHPNEQDIADAKAFAKKVLALYFPVEKEEKENAPEKSE